MYFLVLIICLFVFLFSWQLIQSHAQADIAACRSLLQRVVPKKATQFAIESLQKENNQDVFEIENLNSKIVLRGSSGVAIASALYFYLNE